MTSVTYRHGTPKDMRPVHRLFRTSLYDLLYRLGQLDSPDLSDADLQANWDQRHPLYEYLTHHADQYWIAERGGQIVGFARSVVAGDLRELTEFFVDPSAQSDGVGRDLLARAFPDDGKLRCVIATADIRAHARYLKAGLYPRMVMYEMLKMPAAQPPNPRLVVEEATADARTLARFAIFDELVLGVRRDAYHRWLLAARQGLLYRVDGQVVGYGYVPRAGWADCGPFALSEAAYFPMVLAHAETHCAALNLAKMELVMPGHNAVAMHYALAQGFRLDPFIMPFLSNRPFGRFELYVATTPSLML